MGGQGGYNADTGKSQQFYRHEISIPLQQNVLAIVTELWVTFQGKILLPVKHNGFYVFILFY